MQTLKARGYERLVLQVGRGSVLPEADSCPHLKLEAFRFKDSIAEDMKQADLVVSHAGECDIKNLETLSLLPSCPIPPHLANVGQNLQLFCGKMHCFFCLQKLALVLVISSPDSNNDSEEFKVNTGILSLCKHQTGNSYSSQWKYQATWGHQTNNLVQDDTLHHEVVYSYNNKIIIQSSFLILFLLWNHFSFKGVDDIAVTVSQTVNILFMPEEPVFIAGTWVSQFVMKANSVFLLSFLQ